MTIAQQLKITEFPFIIKDSKGNQIYIEISSGYWARKEFDSNYNQILWETSKGLWWKQEFDSHNNQISYENSNGTCVSYRPKPVTELTMDEIAKKFNVPVETLKIKK